MRDVEICAECYYIGYDEYRCTCKSSAPEVYPDPDALWWNAWRCEQKELRDLQAKQFAGFVADHEDDIPF